MIEHSIATAQDSQLFDRILVSTDCPEVTRIARAAGAEVPFVRPARWADDHAPTLPVIRHAVQWLLQQGTDVQHACCLYATAPFVQVPDLQQGWEILKTSPQVDFAFSAVSYDFPILRAFRLTDRDTMAGPGTGNSTATDSNRTAPPMGWVDMFWPEHESSRSQDLPEAYHDAGQFYWGSTSAWLQCDRIFQARSTVVLLPRYRVQDIDTPEDWERAEVLFRLLKSESSPPSYEPADSSPIDCRLAGSESGIDGGVESGIDREVDTRNPE